MPTKKKQKTAFESEVSQYNSRLLTLSRQNDIITMLLEGKERKQIAVYISNKYKISTPTAQVYISHGATIIKERKNFEVNNLLSLHISRYEYIYGKLYDMGAWHAAGTALKSKEKLLGFHKQGFHMKVTQGEIQEIHQKTFMDEYNLDKISEEQKNRLDELLTKAKRKNASNASTTKSIE